jgi:hypothetical protein
MADPDPTRSRARDCGIDLVEASRSLAGLRVPSGEIALVLALAGRERRLLCAAYLLTDRGFELEASALRRTLVDYALRMPWLLENVATNVRVWQREDARIRLRGDDNVRGDLNAPTLAMPEAMRAETQELFDRLTNELKAEGASLQLPKLEQLVGPYTALYSAYRWDSQVGAHTTPLAAEQVLSREPGGVLVTHEIAVEHDGVAQVDTYSGCAGALLLILTALAERLDPPPLDPAPLEAIRVALNATREPP